MKTLNEILAMPPFSEEMQCMKDKCGEQLTHVGYYNYVGTTYDTKVYYSSKCAPFGAAFDIQPLNVERKENAMKTLKEILAMPLSPYHLNGKNMTCAYDGCKKQLTHVSHENDTRRYYSSKCAPNGAAYDIQPLNESLDVENTGKKTETVQYKRNTPESIESQCISKITEKMNTPWDNGWDDE